MRLAMALGESVIDVSRLKDGQNVALLKTSDNWRFSLSGQLDAIASGGEASLSDGAFSAEGAQDDEGLTLGYKDYLRLFLLLKDGNTLAQRTARLIELNVTNKRENIGDLADRDGHGPGRAVPDGKCRDGFQHHHQRGAEDAVFVHALCAARGQWCCAAGDTAGERDGLQGVLNHAAG